MNFKIPLWVIFLFLGLSIKANEPKPNIIYILADDLGYGELGSYGQEKIKTPHLDEMAKEGMRFTNHYCGAAVCAPSRFTLMTGQHIGRSHSYGQGQGLKKELTLQKLCKQAGYTTAVIGKWGLGKDPNDQGVDEWYGFINQGYAHFYYPERIWKNRERIEIPQNYQKEGLRIKGKYTDKIKGGVYIHDEFTKQALAFIEQNKENPFFLYLPYTIPHVEVIVPEDSMKQYKGKFEARPFDFTKDSPAGRTNRPLGGTKFYDGFGYCSHDTPRMAYAAMISRMDRDIGRIMKLLKDLKIDDKTLVIFSSDNGPAWWSTGGCDRNFFKSSGDLRAGKASYYEGGIRVPMIARWPKKIKAASVSTHVSYFPDMLPTFAELLNIKLTRKTDGISLLPTLLKNGEQKQHKFLFWAQALRMGQWKYVTGGREFSGKRGLGQLFDLETDPGESKNLAKEYPEIVASMKKIINENKIKNKRQKK